MKKFSLLLACIALALPVSAEPVRLETPQGIVIAGEFLKPAASVKPVVILLHGLGSNKEEWEPFAKYLNKRGLGVLYYDQRGHGKSVRTISGGTVSYQTYFDRGPGSEWNKMVDDLGMARDFLSKNYLIQKDRIGVCGASIGANVAFKYAAGQKDVPFAVLLSPGLNYQGLTTEELVASYGNRPLLMVASSGDRYAFQTVLALETLSSQNTLMRVFRQGPNAGHGVQMFRRVSPSKASKLEERIALWIESNVH